MIAAFLFAITTALASQSAKVANDNARIHQFPNRTSPVIAQVNEGHSLAISSEMVADVYKEYWYKTQTPRGEYGFIRANDVVTQIDSDQLRSAGVRPGAGTTEPSIKPDDPTWSFGLRAMGLAGYRMDLKSIATGGDFEGYWALPIDAAGFGPRRIGVGPALITIKELQAVLLSIVFRMFERTRMEPEARVRIGHMTPHGGTVAGINIGGRYPLSLKPGAHASLSIEAGSIFSLSKGNITTYWGSAGVGFHF